MNLADWLRVFRAIHEKAKAGTLSPQDAEDYYAGCDELSRALMAAQKLAPKPGEAPRHALRVARALQVDLETSVSSVRAMTIDLGVSGFSAILAKAPRADDAFRCTVRVPGAPPVVAEALPSEVKQQPGSVRVSFSFRGLSDTDRALLERLVIDTALSQLAS